MELGACAHLAELAASDNPEEHEAAALALSTLLKGTSTSVQAAPLLGSKAASTVSRTAAADLSTPGSPACDLIPAGNFRAGGGIPSSTLLPLLQMVAMYGVNDVGVDLESTLHALCTASSEDSARASITEYEHPQRPCCHGFPLQACTSTCKSGYWIYKSQCCAGSVLIWLQMHSPCIPWARLQSFPVSLQLPLPLSRTTS